MRGPDPDELLLLRSAKEKADKLVAELLARRAELTARPPTVPEAQLAAGREALDRAIASAQQLADSLEAAIRAATSDDEFR